MEYLRQDLEKRLLLIEDLQAQLLQQDDILNPCNLMTAFDGIRDESLLLVSRSAEAAKKQLLVSEQCAQRLDSIYRKMQELQKLTGLKMSKHVLNSLREAEIVDKENSFNPITQEQFLQVPIGLRGKLKLESINEAHKMLWTGFKKTSKLTPQQLNKLGIKPGKVSESKLKVLKSMGFIKIDASNCVLVNKSLVN